MSNKADPASAEKTEVIKCLVKQVECLTKAVEALAFCLQRGPCWGSTGEVESALQKAWEQVEQSKLNAPMQPARVKVNEWKGLRAP